jgi:hypothetical protein
MEIKSFFIAKEYNPCSLKCSNNLLNFWNQFGSNRTNSTKSSDSENSDEIK